MSSIYESFLVVVVQCQFGSVQRERKKNENLSFLDKFLYVMAYTVSTIVYSVQHYNTKSAKQNTNRYKLIIFILYNFAIDAWNEFYILTTEKCIVMMDTNKQKIKQTNQTHDKVFFTQTPSPFLTPPP